MEHSHRNNTPTARYYQDFVLPSVIIANESKVVTSTESKNKLLNLIQFNKDSNNTVAESLKNLS
jgi:D-alanyl-D-alanine carboxypeptidase